MKNATIYYYNTMAIYKICKSSLDTKLADETVVANEKNLYIINQGRR